MTKVKRNFLIEQKILKLTFFGSFFCGLLVILAHTVFREYMAQKYTNLSNQIFLKQHNLTLSKEILNFSLYLDKNNPLAHYILGRIYFIENELKLSVEEYSKAIELNPNLKEAYYGRGLSYGFTTLLSDKSEADFKKYIELDKKEFKETGKHTYGAWAAYNDLAWIYFMRGHFEEAEKISKEAITFSLNNPWLFNTLGTSLLEQSKCQEAENYFGQALISLEKISVEEFGQAYSGDHRKFWSGGKDQLEQAIKNNLKYCEKQKNGKQ